MDLSSTVVVSTATCEGTAVPGIPDRNRTVAAPRTVNAADFAGPQSPTAGIQEAIDALPAAGGVVVIPPGEYLLRQHIVLRSSITLQGSGPSTVLRKNKQVFSRLIAAALKESRSLRVEHADQFQVGDEIILQEYQCCGWEVAHAVVQGASAAELRLDRRLPRAFDPAKGAFVATYFAGITADGASRLLIRDLIVDGRPDENPGPPPDHLQTYWPRGAHTIPGFTCAAISVVRSTDSRVEGCQVVGWVGDGISVQGGASHTVTRCVVRGCRGIGFHPGGGVRESVFSEDVARENAGDGLYFCMNVRHVVVSNSVFARNKGNGIGGLGDGGDKYNVVTNNVCEGNGQNGIALFDGDNNTVSNNVCLNNSQTVPRRNSGISLNQTAETVVCGNRCLDDQETKTQKHGIQEFSSCRWNLLSDNLCRGNADSGLALEGKESQQNGNLE